MESNKNDSLLLGCGITQEQIERLRRFRSAYQEKEQLRFALERHRLEFARWLVSTGRMTDDLPGKRDLRSSHLGKAQASSPVQY